MLNCENPVLLGGAFPCGKCAACLSKRRRTWAHRIMLETMAHEGKSCFVTLTYTEDTVPRDADFIATLSPPHLRNFLKRLRKRSAPTPLRYFACGEYGERSGRPHFHLALYGLDPCSGGPSARDGKGVICLCKTCSDVRKTWDYGHVMVGSLSAKSAMYIAGYVAKNMTSSTDPRLLGRHPEFARMSLNPGIGVPALREIIAVCKKYDLPTPTGIRHGKTVLPLGRYLRNTISKEVRSDAEIWLRSNMDAVRALRALAWKDQKRPLEILAQISPKYQPPTQKERQL